MKVTASTTGTCSLLGSSTGGRVRDNWNKTAKASLSPLSLHVPIINASCELSAESAPSALIITSLSLSLSLFTPVLLLSPLCSSFPSTSHFRVWERDFWCVIVFVESNNGLLSVQNRQCSVPGPRTLSNWLQSRSRLIHFFVLHTHNICIAYMWL